MKRVRGRKPTVAAALCWRVARVMPVVATLWHVCAAQAQAVEPCGPVLARVVSVEGRVDLRRGGAGWAAVGPHAALCAGDSVRVQPRSRAALQMTDETTVRLDQGTVLTLAPPESAAATWLQQLRGGLHVITRKPRAFSVKTPFVNANVEGTEFAVRIDDTATTVSVFEGTVVADNAGGSVALGSGEAAVVTAAGAAPRKELVLRSVDAVEWTLHFPTVLDFRPDRTGARGDAARARSVDLYRGGRFTEALEALGAAPAAPTADELIYRAALLLAVGRADEARPDLARALQLDPRRSEAIALQSVMALVGNEKERALALARQAVAVDPASAGALIALSFAQQAHFDIDAALASVEQALARDPSNALAHARRAELEMSSGRLDAALAAAEQAVRLNPDLGRTQTVLGFAHLVRIDIPAASAAFERAAALDPSDPLPRLGLGLAKIRKGDLAGGRAEIEVAAILDPRDPLVRSYLGKAYFEEKRDLLAAGQFKAAMERDPNDPTAYFYDAVRALADNLPVEALNQLGRSIALNDNRAVYRSRLLLDQDQAARMVGLARNYRMLGFDQLALLEAVKSLSADPGDSSAHRFLADAGAGQVRSEAARVSETLQAQIRQPLGLNLIEPYQLANRPEILEGVGPVQASRHELTPLFGRDQVALKVDALVGEHRTAGDQLFLTGLTGNLAYSLGQFHYETDGLRPNNDSRRDLYNAFVQWGLTPSVRVQAELRDDHAVLGDPAWRFDENNFSLDNREEVRLQTARLGAFVQLDPASSLALSAIAGRGENLNYLATDPTVRIEDRERHRALEIQHITRWRGVGLTSGVSWYGTRTELTELGVTSDQRTTDRNLYSIATFYALPWGLRPQLGLSYDTHDETGDQASRWDPKLGLLWALSPDTTLRAAAFRTVKRNFVANQTLQPTQIVGFDQFFDEPNGTVSRRAGAAVHHRFGDRTFAGAEGSARNLDVPTYPGAPSSRWTERQGRAYAYHILDAQTALTAEVQWERLQRPDEDPGNERFTHLQSWFVPLSLRRFWTSSWSLLLKATYINQSARHENPATPEYVDGQESVVVVDANLAYQLPNRAGTLSLDARNLFDQRFRYQEIDVFSAPRVSPRRQVQLRLSTSF